MANYNGNVLICLFGCLSACSFPAYAFTTLLNKGLKGVFVLGQYSSSDNSSSDSDNNSSDSASTSQISTLLTRLSKAKVQASMAKASGSKAKASPKTLIVKSPVLITNCVLGLANSKTWDVILSKTFGVKITSTMTYVVEKKGKRKTEEIIVLSSDSSDDSKWPSIANVPKEGPSIASVPKKGPSIQGLLD
ncbi:hypothetical protein Tco_1378410 [Tanacetum coccineum]